MSEYAQNDNNTPHHFNDTNLHSLADAANSSIIGKVKSRVSSILPNRLSKWFSPSAKLQNDSLNGSITTTLPARRRRRVEVEEEENYEEDDMRHDGGDYEENNHRMCTEHDLSQDREDDEEENDEDEDSQSSDEEYTEIDITKQTKRDLNVETYPPAKRSRLNIGGRESPLITRRQPLLSSTPAIGSSYLRNSPITNATVPRSSYQRFTNLNLYANQSKKEPAFNFGQQKETKSTKVNTDIIDLISNPYEYEEKHTQSSNAHGDSCPIISSRKSLNIPTSVPTLSGVEHRYSVVSQLKRQPLSTAKINLSTTNTVSVPPGRTSITMQEMRDKDEQEQCGITKKSDDVLSDGNDNSYNGQIEKYNNMYAINKRPKLINGTSLNTPTNTESNETILIDSGSESGESVIDGIKGNSSDSQRKTGLFNMSTTGNANTRNSSRTSSFGNGLNFYSHLEGRKSLFDGANNVTSNTLSNSTLSLTSFNRRQFNASIYGSTSALSDSRLLNTFSPFYKGKTTYGGAAAYNKYAAGSGVSAVRITPTLIRPTSSLSTLSSSHNSSSNNVNSQIGENSIISSTAKRILDLINDFATPLSEAKKMADNLKTSSNIQIPLQAKSRLNESDLNASRAMRLSQVRTPYSRPAVILRPSGNASGRGTIGDLLPPVKELQVPTMSQLLQMKKIQKTTERARKITQNSVTNIEVCEYSLPDFNSNKTSSNNILEQDKQKHTNKIRSKVTNSLRSSAASKDLQDEEPPPPVNLPNIAFPIMQSIPKIDIQINKSPISSSTSSQSKSPTLPSNGESLNFSSKTTSFGFNHTLNKTLTQTSVSTTDNNKMQSFSSQPTLTKTISTSTSKSINTFEFSEPLQIVGVTSLTQSITRNDINKFKFSPPLGVHSSNSEPEYNTQPKIHHLKEGSCLDALYKPFSLPTTSKVKNANTSATNTSSNVNSGFGNQFKKTNEWECDTCMILNKSDVNKCVACESTRKQNLISVKASATSITPSFGQQFKKSFDEWECETCMIRNKQESTKCVACETVRKGATNTLSTLPLKSSLEGTFKSKSCAWECSACMISNKNDADECIACRTKRSSISSAVSPSAVSATELKFCVTNTNSDISCTDVGFKSLAAQQKASKWECDACMTRNDSNRTKCACCEQLKPGMTSVESTNSSLPKFQFGATTAAKFNFGFGTGANAPKEEDIRKELVKNNVEVLKPSTALLGLGAAPEASAQVGFQFGIKPAVVNMVEEKKDETDASKNVTGFKFGIISGNEPKVSEAPVVAPTSTGFTLTSKSLTAATTSTTITSSNISANTPSVQFSLPTTSTNTTVSSDKPTGVATPTFNFGTRTATSTENINETKTTPNVGVDEKKPLGSFSFKTPTISAVSTKNSGFVFGLSTTANSAAVSSSNNTTITTITTTSSITTAAVKPMFSFGSLNSITPTNSQASPSLGGFSFGSGSAKDTSASTGSTLFTAVTSTSTVSTANTSTANTSLTNTTITPLSTSTTTAPAPTNIFGTFSGGGSSPNASATPIFGSSINSPANNNLTTVSSSTNNSTAENVPQFGVFSTKTTPNVFGTFGSNGNNSAGGNNSLSVIPAETKPTLPVFGKVVPSSTSQSSQSTLGGFVFGSNSSNNKTLVPETSATSSVTSTSTSWPKNNFVFGSATPATPNINIGTSSSTSENKETVKHSVFGSFSSPSTISNNLPQTSSIFGATSSNIASSSSGTITSGSTNSSTNLFGTNSAPIVTSIFGANSSGNALTPAPAFGSSPFGGAASSTSATPTFGSTAASAAITFGSFGGGNSNATTNTTEIKKPETAFNFGAAPSTQSTSGGFNFGSTSTSKPAFNFGNSTTTQQPTFNFTGSSELQNSTKPFQFGATSSAPVFNFYRGALEGTSNAPFQFNAGAAPVSSNIFAPAPTLGSQSAQQTKRKVRAPIRRVTQR